MQSSQRLKSRPCNYPVSIRLKGVGPFIEFITEAGSLRTLDMRLVLSRHRLSSSYLNTAFINAHGDIEFIDGISIYAPVAYQHLDSSLEFYQRDEVLAVTQGISLKCILLSSSSREAKLVNIQHGEAIEQLSFRELTQEVRVLLSPRSQFRDHINELLSILSTHFKLPRP